VYKKAAIALMQQHRRIKMIQHGASRKKIQLAKHQDDVTPAHQKYATNKASKRCN
jgi:hypothetical protein